ncbi:hypothetical protein JBE04_19130 [Streptomyces sp. PRKS01-29]|nr:hypothetical protein [Streptomyces sabulosicollis]MBI0296519.1 hypothetical protein [Streptomyces sabulosicollis]
MAGGKFEDRSHDELYNMVATAKPGALTDVGAALMAAFDDISAIAEELKAHAERVHWEGEGADAFREWGREVAKQTHKMADYTLLVGVHMSAAGQGLTEVKAAMPAPTAADDKKHKSDAEKAVADKHRLEALQQMDKLDSYYETAYTEINGLEEPNFPLLPDLGSGWGDYSSGTSAGASSSTGETQGTGHVTPLSVASDSRSAPKAALPGGIGNEGHVGRDVDLEPGTSMAIDSTDTLPSPDVIEKARQPALPPDGPDQQPGPVGPGLRAPRDPFLPSAPPPVRGGGKPVREPIGPYQGAVKQPRPTGLPRTGLPDGIHGGQQARPPGQTNTPRIPRGRVIGEEQGLMRRGPMGPATHGFKGSPSPANGGPGRRLASEPGGTVDSPRGPNNANGQRLPKGTVVGDEHGIPPRRGPLGTGGVSPEGGVHAPGSSGGQGRRLASEAGGPVSGSRSGRGAQSEFTPGGSGLVRGNQEESEAMPRSGRAAPAPNGSEPSGSRPDYLQEDEESWSGGRRDTVPPVID